MSDVEKKKDTHVFVKEEDFKGLVEILSEINKNLSIVGNFFVKAVEAASVTKESKVILNEESKKAIINAGISVDEVDKYYVDIKNGEILKK